MTESSPARPVRRGRALVQHIGDGTAVYDPDTGALHSLNASALAIWELCDGATTPDEIADAVASLTDLDIEAARRDVLAALERLSELGLIDT